MQIFVNSVSTIQYQLFSINNSVSIIQYQLFSINNSEPTIQFKQSNMKVQQRQLLTKITASKFKSYTNVISNKSFSVTRKHTDMPFLSLQTIYMYQHRKEETVNMILFAVVHALI